MTGIPACTCKAFSPQITLETTIPQDYQPAMSVTARQVVLEIVGEASNVPEL